MPQAPPLELFQKIFILLKQQCRLHYTGQTFFYLQVVIISDIMFMYLIWDKPVQLAEMAFPTITTLMPFITSTKEPGIYVKPLA